MKEVSVNQGLKEVSMEVCRKDLLHRDNERWYRAIRLLRPILALSFFSLVSILSGCATTQPLPTPASPGSAMIVLEAKLVGNSWRNKAPRPPTHVYLKRVSGGAKRINETTRNKFYYFYTNVPPGRYQVDFAELVMESGSVPLTGVVEGRAGTPEIRTRFRFSPETRRKTSLTLKSGTVVYMGEFKGKFAHNPNLFKPSTLYKWEVLGTSGNRTQEGKSRAFDFIKRNHPDSGWVQKLR